MSIVAIDDRRRKLGVSIDRLLREASVHRDTWFNGKKDARAIRQHTLRRLDDALDRIGRGAEPKVRPNLLEALAILITCIVAQASGLDPHAVRAHDFEKQRPRDPAWLAAARLRRRAIYLAVVVFKLPNVAVAEGFRCTRQNVFHALADVEDQRDDPAIDALLDRCEEILKTGAG